MFGALQGKNVSGSNIIIILPNLTLKKSKIMINNKGTVGKLGEGIACRILIKKGYKILDRNFRKKFGEIDIVARASNGTLIFCEVKTMVEKLGFPSQLSPEDNLTFHKAQKMKRAAQFYAAKNPGLINEEMGWRIDLIAIVLADRGEDGIDKATIKRIQHYENI